VQVNIPSERGSDSHQPGNMNISITVGDDVGNKSKQQQQLQMPSQQPMLMQAPIMPQGGGVFTGLPMQCYGAIPLDPHLNLIMEVPGVRFQAVQCSGMCGSPIEFRVEIGTLAQSQGQPMRGELGRDGCCDQDLQFRIFQGEMRGVHVTYKQSCCDNWFEVRYNGQQIGRGDPVTDGCCTTNLSVKDQQGREVFLVPPPPFTCCPGSEVTHNILDPKTRAVVSVMTFKQDTSCCPDMPIIAVEFGKVTKMSPPHLRLLLISVGMALCRNIYGYNR